MLHQTRNSRLLFKYIMSFCFCFSFFFCAPFADFSIRQPRKKFLCCRTFNEVTCNAKKKKTSEENEREKKHMKRATKRIRELLCQFSDDNDCKTGTSADFSFSLFLKRTSDEKKKKLCARDRFSSFICLHFPFFLLHYIANFALTLFRAHRFSTS